MRSGASNTRFGLLLAAALGAAGMWIYAARVLIPYQNADAAAHSRPRGNLSDLYPRWLGARELLRHGRDPYSAEVTREIQAGYYGRPLDLSRPKSDDPRDQQGFAYPVYIVFPLAPTIGFPFAIVQKSFFWILLVLTSASVLLWLRVLRWPVPWSTQVSLVVLTLGSLPVMQGLKLQQMSLLVAGLLAIAMALLATDHPVPAGILLAFSTIKPQLVLLPLGCLAIWTLGDWPRRWRWAASFVATMAILLALSEWYLPHWIPRFWQAILEYRRYTGTMSVSDVLIGPPRTRAVEVLAFAGMMIACWRERRQVAGTDAFGVTLSLALATTVLVVPSYAPYNQVLLIPALLLLVKDRRTIWQSSVASRILFMITAALVGWPWIASFSLTVLSFLMPQATVERAWAVPFWTVTQIPVGVAALMLTRYYQRAKLPR